MKKHIHNWNKVGSSTNPDGLVGDIEYACECGSSWKVEVPQDIYWEMPNEIQGKEPPEPVEVNTPFKE